MKEEHLYVVDQNQKSKHPIWNFITFLITLAVIAVFAFATYVIVMTIITEEPYSNLKDIEVIKCYANMGKWIMGGCIEL